MKRIQYKWDRLCKYNIERESLRKEDNLLNMDYPQMRYKTFLNIIIRAKRVNDIK
jgi:hypothetical protein